ncbi:unnamed protein product [Amoebophrya sp. A120]|nr:unnamed protein product [Amoebophrya sp. A120]|eukprot:GSA120T00001224001.1
MLSESPNEPNTPLFTHNTRLSGSGNQEGEEDAHHPDNSTSTTSLDRQFEIKYFDGSAFLTGQEEHDEDQEGSNTNGKPRRKHKQMALKRSKLLGVKDRNEDVSTRPLVHYKTQFLLHRSAADRTENLLHIVARMALGNRKKVLTDWHRRKSLYYTKTTSAEPRNSRNRPQPKDQPLRRITQLVQQQGGQAHLQHLAQHVFENDALRPEDLTVITAMGPPSGLVVPSAASTAPPPVPVMSSSSSTIPPTVRARNRAQRLAEQVNAEQESSGQPIGNGTTPRPIEQTAAGTTTDAGTPILDDQQQLSPLALATANQQAQTMRLTDEEMNVVRNLGPQLEQEAASMEDGEEGAAFSTRRRADGLGPPTPPIRRQNASAMLEPGQTQAGSGSSSSSGTTGMTIGATSAGAPAVVESPHFLIPIPPAPRADPPPAPGRRPRADGQDELISTSTTSTSSRPTAIFEAALLPPQPEQHVEDDQGDYAAAADHDHLPTPQLPDEQLQQPQATSAAVPLVSSPTDEEFITDINDPISPPAQEGVNHDESSSQLDLSTLFPTSAGAAAAPITPFVLAPLTPPREVDEDQEEDPLAPGAHTAPVAESPPFPPVGGVAGQAQQFDWSAVANPEISDMEEFQLDVEEGQDAAVTGTPLENDQELPVGVPPQQGLPQEQQQQQQLWDPLQVVGSPVVLLDAQTPATGAQGGLVASSTTANFMSTSEEVAPPTGGSATVAQADAPRVVNNINNPNIPEDYIPSSSTSSPAPSTPPGTSTNGGNNRVPARPELHNSFSSTTINRVVAGPREAAPAVGASSFAIPPPGINPIDVVPVAPGVVQTGGSSSSSSAGGGPVVSENTITGSTSSNDPVSSYMSTNGAAYSTGLVEDVVPPVDPTIPPNLTTATATTSPPPASRTTRIQAPQIVPARVVSSKSALKKRKPMEITSKVSDSTKMREFVIGLKRLKVLAFVLNYIKLEDDKQIAVWKEKTSQIAFLGKQPTAGTSERWTSEAAEVLLKPRWTCWFLRKDMVVQLRTGYQAQLVVSERLEQDWPFEKRTDTSTMIRDVVLPPHGHGAGNEEGFLGTRLKSMLPRLDLSSAVSEEEEEEEALLHPPTGPRGRSGRRIMRRSASEPILRVPSRGGEIIENDGRHDELHHSRRTRGTTSDGDEPAARATPRGPDGNNTEEEFRGRRNADTTEEEEARASAASIFPSSRSGSPASRSRRRLPASFAASRRSEEPNSPAHHGAPGPRQVLSQDLPRGWRGRGDHTSSVFGGDHFHGASAPTRGGSSSSSASVVLQEQAPFQLGPLAPLGFHTAVVQPTPRPPTPTPKWPAVQPKPAGKTSPGEQVESAPTAPALSFASLAAAAASRAAAQEEAARGAQEADGLQGAANPEQAAQTVPFPFVPPTSKAAALPGGKLAANFIPASTPKPNAQIQQEQRPQTRSLRPPGPVDPFPTWPPTRQQDEENVVRNRRMTNTATHNPVDEMTSTSRMGPLAPYRGLDALCNSELFENDGRGADPGWKGVLDIAAELWKYEVELRKDYNILYNTPSDKDNDPSFSASTEQLNMPNQGAEGGGSNPSSSSATTGMKKSPSVRFEELHQIPEEERKRQLLQKRQQYAWQQLLGKEEDSDEEVEDHGLEDIFTTGSSTVNRLLSSRNLFDIPEEETRRIFKMEETQLKGIFEEVDSLTDPWKTPFATPPAEVIYNSSSSSRDKKSKSTTTASSKRSRTKDGSNINIFAKRPPSSASAPHGRNSFKSRKGRTRTLQKQKQWLVRKRDALRLWLVTEVQVLQQVLQAETILRDDSRRTRNIESNYQASIAFDEATKLRQRLRGPPPERENSNVIASPFGLGLHMLIHAGCVHLEDRRLEEHLPEFVKRHLRFKRALNGYQFLAELVYMMELQDFRDAMRERQERMIDIKSNYPSTTQGRAEDRDTTSVLDIDWVAVLEKLVTTRDLAFGEIDFVDSTLMIVDIERRRKVDDLRNHFEERLGNQHDVDDLDPSDRRDRFAGGRGLDVPGRNSSSSRDITSIFRNTALGLAPPAAEPGRGGGLLNAFIPPQPQDGSQSRALLPHANTEDSSSRGTGDPAGIQSTRRGQVRQEDGEQEGAFPDNMPYFSDEPPPSPGPSPAPPAPQQQYISDGTTEWLRRQNEMGGGTTSSGTGQVEQLSQDLSGWSPQLLQTGSGDGAEEHELTMNSTGSGEHVASAPAPSDSALAAGAQNGGSSGQPSAEPQEVLAVLADDTTTPAATFRQNADGSLTVFFNDGRGTNDGGGGQQEAAGSSAPAHGDNAGGSESASSSGAGIS